jgi:hypothetical protein
MLYAIKNTFKKLTFYISFMLLFEVKKLMLYTILSYFQK